MKIGIDIGGTNIRIGFNLNNKIIKVVTLKTNINSFEESMNEISSIINENRENHEIKFIGIGCPGPFKNGSTIYNAPNMGDWNDKDPKKAIQVRFRNARIVFINDANLQGINEHQIHKGNPFIFLTFSTGIGGVIIIDNKVLNGYSNTSMEIANAIPSINEFDDINKSGIEFFCSGRNIPIVLKKYGLDVKDAKQAFELYYQKNPIAIKYFNEYKNKMVQFLSTLIYIINPQNIVVNGPLAQNYKDFFNQIFNQTLKLAEFYNSKTNFIYSSNDLEKLLLTASNLDIL